MYFIANNETITDLFQFFNNQMGNDPTEHTVIESSEIEAGYTNNTSDSKSLTFIETARASIIYKANNKVCYFYGGILIDKYNLDNTKNFGAFTVGIKTRNFYMHLNTINDTVQKHRNIINPYLYSNQLDKNHSDMGMNMKSGSLEVILGAIYQDISREKTCTSVNFDVIYNSKLWLRALPDITNNNFVRGHIYYSYGNIMSFMVRAKSGNNIELCANSITIDNKYGVSTFGIKGDFFEVLGNWKKLTIDIRIFLFEAKLYVVIFINLQGQITIVLGSGIGTKHNIQKQHTIIQPNKKIKIPYNAKPIVDNTIL